VEWRFPAKELVYLGRDIGGDLLGFAVRIGLASKWTIGSISG
jgi:hypothetical protein